MPILALALCFGSVAVLGMAGYPHFSEQLRTHLAKRAQEASLQFGEMFVHLSPARLQLLHFLAPPGIGLITWLATGMWIAGLFGAGIGLFAPRFLMRHLQKRRAQQFHGQLVDGLLLLSSCLRAGLSMVQSFTILSEEMAPPISQEFSLLLKEIRMGVNLDEALLHVRQRMPSDDFNLFVTAVLVARETGGDITSVFTQLVETLRERKKVRERIKTLTFMARMQGIVMGALPFGFAYIAYTTNKDHFTYFFQDSLGQVLFGTVVVLQIASVVLFMRFSRSPL